MSSSTIDLIFGVFLGYMLGVIKEKLKWFEKYVSSRRSETDLKESIEDDE